MIKVKKLKRKCGVRGCKCLETYTISRVGETGNSVIACRNCLADALEAIDKLKDAPEMMREPREAPPLFFNPVKKVEPEKVEPEVVEPEATEELTETEDGFVCPHCGKVCKTEQGLQKHIELKHKDVK